MKQDAIAGGRDGWRREVGIAAGLLAVGLIVLPLAIYYLGQRVLGEYAGSGPFGVAESIWLDLLALEPMTWLLVLWPYVTIQLVRAVRRIWRRRL